jgi:hypothetical protein
LPRASALDLSAASVIDGEEEKVFEDVYQEEWQPTYNECGHLSATSGNIFSSVLQRK